MAVVEFPPVPPGEDIVLSATTYASYRRCPEQAAGRLRGVYGPESRSAFVGGLAHRVFAKHLTQGEIAPGELTAVCREEIGSGMNPKLAALGLKPSQLASVIEEVGSLYDRFKATSREGLVGAEVALESEPADGVILRGAVDAVFDDAAAGVRLVDWGCGRAVRPARLLCAALGPGAGRDPGARRGGVGRVGRAGGRGADSGRGPGDRRRCGLGRRRVASLMGYRR